MVQSAATSPEAYLAELGDDRREVVGRLHALIVDALPEGFEATMCYGMIGYVVPHRLYPAGYHCNPDQALPFMNLASQKQYISLYHSGLYADGDLLEWFQQAWADQVPVKLDMGKCCIRLKKPEHIPWALIGELAGKMTPEDWIRRYEAVVKR